MKEPVDHIERPRLPWRSPDEPSITECGYDASKLTREQFFSRFKEYGERRTALLTCMTCMQTARRWPTWEDEPRKALQREIEWEIPWYEKNGHRLKDELIAIQQLIEQRPDEFRTLLETLRERQEWLERKEASKPTPKKARHRYDGL